MKKTKPMTEVQFLAALQKILSAKAGNPHLASQIYDGMMEEVQMHRSIQSFQNFCEEGSLPDLEEKTVAELQTELQEKFGEANVSIAAAESGQALEVEIALPEKILSSKVRVVPPGSEEEEEVKAPFVPFPVSLPQDPGLVWALGRRENLGPDEAARALSKIEEEFWATKKGQQLQRDRVEKSFAEFIVQVPASALTESGLKRHYKTPETLQTLRLLAGTAQPSE